MTGRCTRGKRFDTRGAFDGVDNRNVKDPVLSIGDTMTKSLEAKNREVAEWLGLCWHNFAERPGWYKKYQCTKCGCGFDTKDNPDFISHPVELLRLMFENFYDEIYIPFIIRYTKKQILEDFLFDNTTGKLVEAAWEWKEKQK